MARRKPKREKSRSKKLSVKKQPVKDLGPKTKDVKGGAISIINVPSIKGDA